MLEKHVKEELQALVKKASDIGVVAFQNEVIKVLRGHGLAYSQRIVPDRVGVSKVNRDGFGVSPRDCHRLLCLIADLGWDDRVPQPMCIEIDNGDGNEEFNQRIVNSCPDGEFGIPAFQPNSIRYASLSCSHTNFALRCCVHQMPHQDSNKTLTVDGRLSLDKISNVDEGLARAAREGLTWTVINKDVSEVGEVLSLLQASQNSVSAISRPEHEFQILMRIYSSQVGDPNKAWPDMKAKLLLSKPQCAESTPYMWGFLKRFGGGHKLLEEVEARLKRQTEMSKSLGLPWWKAMGAEGRKGSAEQFVLWRFSVLATALCTEHPITASDMKRSISKDGIKKVMEAEAFLRETKKLTDAMPYVNAARWSCMDKLVLIGMDRMKNKCFEEAMCELCDDIEEEIDERPSNKYDAFMKRSEEGVVADSDAPTADFSYTAEGQLKDPKVLVHEAGFMEGQYVMRKADKTRATIVSIHGGSVTLEVAKGQLMQELQQLEKQHCKVHEGLKLNVRPSKDVIATSNFAIGKLVLVPCTMKISANEPKSGMFVSLAKKIKVGDTMVKFHLQSQVALKVKNDALQTDSSLAPFWMVKTTHEMDEANMAIVEGPKTGHGVPIMKNIVDVAAGDSLIRYVDKEEVEVEPLVDVTVASQPADGAAPKRRRTAKTPE
eukprot:symbB.v1.2.040569.t1/scaffold7341.1/size11812/2